MKEAGRRPYVPAPASRTNKRDAAPARAGLVFRLLFAPLSLRVSRSLAASARFSGPERASGEDSIHPGQVVKEQTLEGPSFGMRDSNPHIFGQSEAS